MRQNTRLAILAAELERQSPPESSADSKLEEAPSEGAGQPIHSATVLPLRGGAPSRREAASKADTPDPRTPNPRTPKMSRGGPGSVQATPSTVPRSTSEGKRECAVCRLQKSPRWRTGPDGPKTLCNRCGVYWATMRHKWPNLVARFKGDQGGTPADETQEESTGTGASGPRRRKPGRAAAPDPTPTPKNTRKRSNRNAANPTPSAQAAGGHAFLDSATANGFTGGVATRSADHAPAAARQLELPTEEKSKPPKKRWIEELTDSSPKRRSGQAVRWRSLSDEGDVAAPEPSNAGPATRRRTESELLRSSMGSQEDGPKPDVREEGRMQRGLARILEAQREANGGSEAEPSPKEAPSKRRRTELDALLDLDKKEEVPTDKRGDGRLQRGLARVLEAQRLANGDEDPLENGDLTARRRPGTKANGSLGEEESVDEEHEGALNRNRKSKPPPGKSSRELRPRPDSGHKGSESESEGERGKAGTRKGSLNGSKKRTGGEVLSDGHVRAHGEENGYALRNLAALCMVCEASPRDALFTSCGHFYFCYNCAAQINKGKGDCPKCGLRVTGVQKVVL